MPHRNAGRLDVIASTCVHGLGFGSPAVAVAGEWSERERKAAADHR